MKTILNFEEHLQHKYRIKTIIGILNEVKLYENWSQKENIQIEKATYNEILSYINYCYSQGNKKQTIRQKLNSLKHYYNHLQEQQSKEGKESSNYIINPVREIKLRNIERKNPQNNIKYEDLEKLYNEYTTTTMVQKRNKCILGLLIYQGLGTGEINKLEVKDVKLEEGKIYAPSVGRSNSRTLKLEAHQILQMQNYILLIRPMLQAQAKDASEYLFIAANKSNRKKERGETFTGLHKIFHGLKKQAPEIKEAKDIRSAVISHWLKQYNLRQVQYMIGHKYVSSTEKYSRNKLESLQEQIEKLHPMK